MTPALLALALSYDPAAGRFEARPPVTGAWDARVAGAAAPLAGESGRDARVAWFRPRFPVAPGVAYAVTFTPAGGTPVALSYTSPLPDRPRSRVSAVTPSGDVLPENLLRLYVHFTEPMALGEAAARARLLDARGQTIEGAFLELDEELWDHEGRRLTLLIDPGRVKRGLKPREDDGAVLDAGQSYTLDIDACWPDALGRPLTAGFRKPFRAGRPLTKPLDAANWPLLAPTTPDSTLELRPGLPLDAALAQRVIRVERDGRPVAGTIELSAGESEWRFRPATPWLPGDYTLSIGPTLEDVAGNRASRAFDADGDTSNDAKARAVERRFEVR